MYRKLFCLIFLTFAFLVTFFLQFGGMEGFAANWRAFSNDSTWIPFGAYGNRVEDASKLRRFDATHVIIEDQSLFWKGMGAVVAPQLSEDGELIKLMVTSPGSGYGSQVKARISGAGADLFELGQTIVRDGHLISIEIIKTSKWYDSSRMLMLEEDHPFSGTAEIKYPNGLLMESRHYLEGELHGKWLKWKSNGIPLFEKDYVHGLKHGAHKHWYGNPKDPKDYKAHDSLWMELNDEAKKEFAGNYPSPESNAWMVESYKEKGGSFTPKLLENYDGNRLNGVCEGFDTRGQRTFRDEYAGGRRINHKSFDTGTNWKLPKKLSGWAD